MAWYAPMMSGTMRSLSFAMILIGPLFVAGCGDERAPMLAGGREVKSWVADLRSSKAKVRRRAVLKLGNVGDADPAVATALSDAHHDPDAQVRHDAVLAVVKLKAPGDEIVATLQAMAKGDKDARARESAGKALEKLGRGD